MKDFPLPPGVERKLDEQKISSRPAPLVAETPPKPEDLNDNEITLLLNSNLRIDRRSDPNIIGFIKEYMACRHVSQAAKAIGLTPSQGRNIRNYPDVHAAISALTQKAVMKHGLDPGEIVERMKEVADVDLGEFQNPDGSYKTSLLDLSPATRRAIKKFEVKNVFDTDPNGMKIKTGELIKVELWDKMKASELLGRETDLFKETTIRKHDVTENMENVLLGASARGTARAEKLREVQQLNPPPIDIESKEKP